MKSIKRLQLFSVIVFLAIAGCKKGQEVDPNPDTSSAQQLSKDESLFKRAADEIVQDATLLSIGRFEKSTHVLPCNANVDSVVTLADSTYIYITFNGPNCSGIHKRTGKMLIRKKTGAHWVQAGTTIITEVTNYKLTHTANNKSLTASGKTYIQNVSGGNLALLGTLYSSIIHRNWGYMEIEFQNEKNKKWNHNRQTVYSQTLQDLIITEDGFGIADGYQKLATWGQTRQGQKFYNQIEQPIVIKQACNFLPVSGIQKQYMPGKETTVTITFGYGDDNQPVAEGDCATRLRFDWEKKNQSGTIYLPLL